MDYKQLHRALISKRPVIYTHCQVSTVDYIECLCVTHIIQSMRGGMEVLSARVIDRSGNSAYIVDAKDLTFKDKQLNE